MTAMTGAARILVISLAMAMSACADEPALVSIPTSPSPPPSVSAPTVALVGVVGDAGRPVENASVGATPLRWTAPWSGQPRSARSDASGRYQFTNLPQDPDVAYVRAYKDGYVQQCAVAVTLQADASADLTIAEYANARIAGLPVAPNMRQLSGVIYETTESGRRPVSGAWVGWESSMDYVAADTRTDASGRYRLCGLPMQRIDGLFAVRARSTQVTWTSVDAGGDAVFDFEVK